MITAEYAATLTDYILSLKLRTLAGQASIFTEDERKILIMEAVNRLTFPLFKENITVSRDASSGVIDYVTVEGVRYYKPPF